MALFLLSTNLGWVQGHFNFTETSLRYHEASGEYADFEIIRGEIQEEIFERVDTILLQFAGAMYRS